MKPLIHSPQTVATTGVPLAAPARIRPLHHRYIAVTSVTHYGYTTVTSALTCEDLAAGGERRNDVARGAANGADDGARGERGARRGVAGRREAAVDEEHVVGREGEGAATVIDREHRRRARGAHVLVHDDAGGLP